MTISGSKEGRVDPCEFVLLREIDETKIEKAIRELVEYKEGIIKLGKPSDEIKDILKDISRKREKYRTLLELRSDLLEKILKKRDKSIRKYEWFEKIYEMIPQRIRERIKNISPYGDLFYTEKYQLDGSSKYLGEIISREELETMLELFKKKGYLDKTQTYVRVFGLRIATIENFLWTEKTANILGEKFLNEILEGLGKEEVYTHGYELSDEQREYEPGDSFESIVIDSLLDAAVKDPTFSSTKPDLRVWKTGSREKSKNFVVVSMDTSGSMKGEKLWAAKKAALAVSQLVKCEENELFLTGFNYRPYDLDLEKLLNEIAEDLGTNIQGALKYSKKILAGKNGNKHLILITDGFPQYCIFDNKAIEILDIDLLRSGNAPNEFIEKYRLICNITLKEAENLRREDIRTSVISVDEHPLGVEFGKELAEIGGGDFYQTSPEELGRLLVGKYTTLTSP